AGVEHGHDVWMAEAGDSPRLARKALDEDRVPRMLERQYLHGNGPLEHAIATTVDEAHATSPDHLEQLVASREYLCDARHHCFASPCGRAHNRLRLPLCRTGLNPSEPG